MFEESMVVRIKKIFNTEYNSLQLEYFSWNEQVLISTKKDNFSLSCLSRSGL